MEDLHAALDRVLDKDATPDLVPAGALVLQPNEERRRSGSHYTPRELTEPIVRHTLAPILERLRGEDGRAPTPAQILDIKVCDPAMGSGAFLVETCRQLADALIDAWGAHGEMPVIPPDEDEVIHARRLVAQKCLYGVDRNPMAVDLAKVSLWLSTLARDHPLTFVDHAFRHGDSLVGLSRRQIEAFHWLRDAQPLQKGIEVGWVREHMAKATELRRRIREAGEEVSDQELHDLWHDARNEIDAVRLYGDLALAAFFAEAKPKQREAKRLEFAGAVTRNEAIRYLSWLEEQRDADPPLAPFHWEIEFPEVFDRENPGFDAFVGNPPFAGKNAVAAGNVGGYPDWLKTRHEQSHGNADLVAHFFRRAFDLVRDGRHVRPDRHQHDRPGRHPLQRSALDLRARRRDLPRHQAVSVARRGRGRRERPACRQDRGSARRTNREPECRGCRFRGQTRDGPVSWKKGARRGEGRRHYRFPVPPGRPR